MGNALNGQRAEGLRGRAENRTKGQGVGTNPLASGFSTFYSQLATTLTVISDILKKDHLAPVKFFDRMYRMSRIGVGFADLGGRAAV